MERMGSESIVPKVPARWSHLPSTATHRLVRMSLMTGDMHDVDAIVLEAGVVVAVVRPWSASR